MPMDSWVKSPRVHKTFLVRIMCVHLLPENLHYTQTERALLNFISSIVANVHMFEVVHPLQTGCVLMLSALRLQFCFKKKRCK